MNEPNQMKLFVAGQLSSNPDEWDEFCKHVLVLAESAEAARQMVDFTNTVTEVSMEKPAVLN